MDEERWNMQSLVVAYWDSRGRDVGWVWFGVEISEDDSFKGGMIMAVR